MPVAMIDEAGSQQRPRLSPRPRWGLGARTRRAGSTTLLSGAAFEAVG